MSKSVFRKFGSVIDFLVESNHCRHIVFLEVVEVSFRSMQWMAVFNLNQNEDIAANRVIKRLDKKLYYNNGSRILLPSRNT